MSDRIVFIIVLSFGIFIGLSSANSKLADDQYAYAIKLCKENQGVKEFNLKTLDPNSVICKNSAKFILESDK